MGVLTANKGDLVRIQGFFGTNATRLAAAAVAGATTIAVRDASGYTNGDTVLIDPGKDEWETRTVSSVSGNTITLGAALTYGHDAGARVWEGKAPTTLTLNVLDPAADLTETAIGALTSPSTGYYHHDVSITAVGRWFWRWEATGAVEAATPDGEILVSPTRFT